MKGGTLSPGKVSKAAVLVDREIVDIQEFEIPKIGDRAYWGKGDYRWPAIARKLEEIQ
jgi:hypothetical protein